MCAVVESGGAKDFAYPKDLYPAVKVDRVLHDGDEVRLGGAVLVAHKTAGPHARLYDLDDAGADRWSTAQMW